MFASELASGSEGEVKVIAIHCVHLEFPTGSRLQLETFGFLSGLVTSRPLTGQRDAVPSSLRHARAAVSRCCEQSASLVLLWRWMRMETGVLSFALC